MELCELAPSASRDGLLDPNDRLAVALVKLLSALGKVSSGVMVVRMSSQPSPGLGLRVRSPSPLTLGDPGRQE